MRFRVDSSWMRAGEDRRIVLGGSPFRLFRLTAAGARVADRIERGAEVERTGLVDRLVDGGAIHPLLGQPVGRWARADVTVVTPQLGGVVAGDDRVTVDDGSVPPILGATVRLPTNRGPATARNVGRGLVHSEFIAFVDADVDVAAENGADGVASWLDALLPHFDDPRVGLVAPRVLGGRRTSLDLGDEPARVRVGTRIAYVPAAAVVVRAVAFDDVGGFDECLRFGEDVDFVWRLDAAGWSCRYEPSSTVWHEPRSGWAARLSQQVGYGSSAAPLALRHPAALAPFRADPLKAAAWVLASIGHPLVAGVFVAGDVTVALRRLRCVPALMTLRLATTAQLASGRQFATAIRRAWWPIVVILGLVSRRARRVAIAAALVDPGAVSTDLAYGWGVWRGMRRHSTWRPIIPSLTGWFNASGRAGRLRSRRSRVTAGSPRGAEH